VLDGPSLTERLAERLARPVDVATRARARLHLLDWLGCVAGGRATFREDDGAAWWEWWDRAALSGNALEMDDVHRGALLHPGPVIWPSVIAARRSWTNSLEKVLCAAVRGYEAMVAVGLAYDAHHYGHFHPTSTAGMFGAAGALACLDEQHAIAGDHRPLLDRIVGQFGSVGSVSGGLWRTRHEPLSRAKQFHIAHAVSTAWLSYRLDLPGPRYILEGEQGLFAAMCRAPTPERMFEAESWRIHEVSFKPYAACRHAHPAIDAALALAVRGALDGDAPILVETYPDAVRFCDNPTPTTDVEAKFSLQHAVALVAVRGAVGLGDFDEAARADPSLAAARARVRLAPDAAIAASYPAHFGARVRVGDAVAEVADALGDPENPLTTAQIVAKARALIAHGGLNAREANLAVDLALNLPEDEPGTELRQLVERWMA